MLMEIMRSRGQKFNLSLELLIFDFSFFVGKSDVGFLMYCDVGSSLIGGLSVVRWGVQGHSDIILLISFDFNYRWVT